MSYSVIVKESYIILVNHVLDPKRVNFILANIVDIYHMACVNGYHKVLVNYSFFEKFFFWVAFCFFYNFMSFIGYGASFIERKKNIKINYRTSFMYFSSIYSIFFIK